MILLVQQMHGLADARADHIVGGRTPRYFPEMAEKRPLGHPRLPRQILQEVFTFRPAIEAGKQPGQTTVGFPGALRTVAMTPGQKPDDEHQPTPGEESAPILIAGGLGLQSVEPDSHRPHFARRQAESGGKIAPPPADGFQGKKSMKAGEKAKFLPGLTQCVVAHQKVEQMQSPRLFVSMTTAVVDDKNITRTDLVPDVPGDVLALPAKNEDNFNKLMAVRSHFTLRRFPANRHLRPGMQKMMGRNDRGFHGGGIVLVFGGIFKESPIRFW